MNKPVLFRSFVSLVIVLVFALSIYPLQEQDLYETYKTLVSEEQKGDADKVINEAKVMELAAKEDGKKLYQSIALEQAGEKLNINLVKTLKSKYQKNLNGSRDAIALVRQHASGSIRLGLDLNGGVEFLFALKANEKAEIEDQEKIKDNFNTLRDQTIEVLRKRLEDKNIFETEFTPIGDKYVSLKAPVVAKDEKLLLLNLIKQAAKLRFRLVHENSDVLVNTKGTPQLTDNTGSYTLMKSLSLDKDGKPNGREMYVNNRRVMTGDNISEAWPTKQGLLNQLQISLKFNKKGAVKFGEVTTEHTGKRLAIVLDGRLYSAPNINEPILAGSASISGDFSQEEAQNISTALVSGSLPLVIDDDNFSVFDTDPTLGAEHVTKGAQAGAVALIVVMIFMALYYLRAGLVANIALVVNIVLVLGALAAFKATLTLPGIAGIILTIGMAVDANVLIFERIREEMEKGKTLRNSIDFGYAKVFSTILDANLTTLFTAIILMLCGTGAIKGFAVTLSIGIATSMFTALFLTRLVFDLMAKYTKFETMKMWKLFSRPNIDFLSLKAVTVVVSTTLLIVAVVALGIRGKDALSVDFTGGSQISFDYDTDHKVAQSDIKSTLEKAGYVNPKVTYKSNLNDDKLEIVITDSSKSNTDKSVAITATTPKDKIANLLNSEYKNAKLKGGSESSLGGLIGWEFTKSAILAIILAMGGIILYISLRFEFTYAIASIIAIIHDLCIATGLYLLLGIFFGGYQLSLPVIAALLTIIGYSLNDTIVVFDRIREDIGIEIDKSYKQIINLSINQTLSRTVLTSLTTLLVLLILFIGGGIAIRDFVTVMLLGVIVGTYSSIFVASPIIAVWHKKIGTNLKIKDEE